MFTFAAIVTDLDTLTITNAESTNVMHNKGTGITSKWFKISPDSEMFSIGICAKEDKGIWVEIWEGEEIIEVKFFDTFDEAKVFVSTFIC